MTKKWILYRIDLMTKTKPVMTAMWATSPKKALKDALKKLFKTRGIEYFVIDDKEFDNNVRLMNYIMKNKKLDAVCKPYENQMFKHDQSACSTDPSQSSPQSPQ